jgi:hypothetical protein
MTEEITVNDSTSSRPLFLRALRFALGRTSAWFSVWVMHIFLAVAPAVVYYAWFRDATAHRYEPGSLFANLDVTFRTDHGSALAILDTANGRVGAVLAVFAMLVSAFCAGGWLQIFLEHGHGRSLRRFFFGGARYFMRFVRVMLLTLLVLALFAWTVYDLPWEKAVLEWALGIPEGDRASLASFGSEQSAVYLTRVQHGLFALLFGLTLVWADYTRTRLALHDTSSALWAGLCTFFAMLAHPIRALRPMFGLLVTELIVVFGAGLIASSIEDEMFEHPELLGTVFLLLIGQFVLLWRLIVRGARYFAAIEVSRDVVRPIARPDPWKKSIGGPGGPRYPLGEDEYNISI